jgi:hypothetical protein
MQQSHTTAATVVIDKATHRLLWSFVASIMFFGVLYTYAISASIVHVVLREEGLIESSEAHSRIGALEAEYFARKNVVDSSTALEMGYKPIAVKQFVTRTSQVLTLNQ